MRRTETDNINQQSFRIPKQTGIGSLFAMLFVLFAISTTVAQANSSLSFEQQLQASSVDTQPINEVHFSNLESFVRNDSLYIAFDLMLQGEILASSNALHIEPVYNTVTTEIRLPKILINGKERSSYYHHEQSLLSQKEELTNKPYSVLVRDSNETQHVSYRYVMPLVSSICKIGVLHIHQFLQDGCNFTLVEERLLPIRYISSKLNPTMFANTVTYIVPDADQKISEDWERTLQTFKANNMEQKGETLSSISTVADFDGGETKLMELADGESYNNMLYELYSSLHRMEMEMEEEEEEVNYTVSPFESKEVENVVQDRPNGSNQKEIFDLTQSKKENDLLKIAAIYFPENTTANINASSVALTEGNVDEAWTYLSRVQDKPEAYNNLGIYYWLKGNKYKAEKYFRKASNVDGQEEKANANLEMLNKYVIR